MDVLSDVLEKVRLRGAVYFKSDFSPPWGMDIPQGPVAQFHILVEGHCLLKVVDRVIALEAGDLIIFPKGTGHQLGDSVESRKVEGSKVVQSILSGNSLFSGDEVAATLVCGHFEFDRMVNHMLIESLPEFIHITRPEIKEKSWLNHVVELVINETESNRQGNEVVIRKLGEILFIHALRAYIQQNEIGTGFLSALRDERICSGLKLMHDSPEISWTLDSLARKVGMSRTSLAGKFREMVGETPMNYLTNWRILIAKELLKETSMSVREVSHKVGYQSETAFNRVFKDRVKLTPLKYRNLQCFSH